MEQLPTVLSQIFQGAFTGTAAIGVFSGALVKEAIQKGVARGVFSNESGLGSAPIAAAAAKTEEPVAVSYTHLDVYKRQRNHFSSCLTVHERYYRKEGEAQTKISLLFCCGET